MFLKNTVQSYFAHTLHTYLNKYKKMIEKLKQTACNCYIQIYIHIQDLKYKSAINMTKLNAYLVSKKHIIYNFLINDRGLIHQCINFSSGSTFLNPFEQEDEAIHRTEKCFLTEYIEKQKIIAYSQNVIIIIYDSHIFDKINIHQRDLRLNNWCKLYTFGICFEDHIFLLLAHLLHLQSRHRHSDLSLFVTCLFKSIFTVHNCACTRATHQNLPPAK